jgi:hypothetical protein
MRLHEQVESALASARRRWQWLRASGAAAVWLGVSAMLWLAFGLATARDLVRRPLVFVIVAGVLFFLSAASLVVILIASSVSFPERGFLARSLERVYPSLLDRLNTLVWLQQRGTPAVPDEYRRRIEWQARGALAYEPQSPVFPAQAVGWRWLAGFVLAVCALAFWARARPWTHLDRNAGVLPDVTTTETAPPTAPGGESAAEVKAAWGEVRITEPGRDLKVTKVDVVPLQIEAATSADLAGAQYITAVGGAKGETHALPKPAEPHYALYKPLLYVDEFRLSDWDVLTYYASAGTREGKSYASEVYFLEVRPFREDLLKMPGGENGKAYRSLSKLSGLVDRQKDVIRETHGYLQRDEPQGERKRQDRQKLSDAEGDLAEASRHLYAEVASTLENADVGVVLDNLAQAEGHLDQAGRSLAADGPKVPEQERDALLSLVATRKALQKAITDHPSAFAEGGDEEREPTAELAGKLKEIAEYRDAEKVARQALDKAALRQKQIADEARDASRARRNQLAGEQEQLRKELSEMAAQHPNLFRSAERERAAADEAMRESASSMGAARSDGGTAAQHAQQRVEALRERVQKGTAGEDLRQAYALKEMIDRQAQGLGKVEKDPSSASAPGMAQTAQEAKQASRELKRLMDDTPAGEAFGDELHEALGPARQAERERRLEDLARAEGAEARRRAAGEARRSMEAVSQAFEHSQPGVSQALRKEDALKEGEDDALDRALRRLEGVVAGQEAGRTRPGEESGRQRRQIVQDLRDGVQRRHRGEPRIDALVQQVERELTRADEHVDPKKLRQLLEEIEQFRVENAARRVARGEDPQLQHIDPSKLPPAYRERIQKYYRKLAEEP